jgi:hypothetical protein
MNWIRKLSIAWALCLCPYSAIFAEATPQSSDYVTLATFNANQGLAQILLKNYSLALEDLQRAAANLERSGKEVPETEFLIRFGQAVAFDNLNNPIQTNRMLEQLRELFDDCDSSGNSANETEMTQPLNVLSQVAQLASSDSVRGELLSYLDPGYNALCCDGEMHAEKHSHFWKKVGKICKQVLVDVFTKFIEQWLEHHK